MLLSGIGVDVDSTVVSSPASPSTAAAALTASAALRVGYMYPLAAYLKFFLGGIQYPPCPLDSTAEAAATSASSGLEKKSRSHTDERG